MNCHILWPFFFFCWVYNSLEFEYKRSSAVDVPNGMQNPITFRAKYWASHCQKSNWIKVRGAWEEVAPHEHDYQNGCLFNKYFKGFMLIWGKDTRRSSVKMRHIRKVAKDRMCPLPLSINNLGQCSFTLAQSLPPPGKWLYPSSLTIDDYFCVGGFLWVVAGSAQHRQRGLWTHDFVYFF